jgi:hypothetical protein
MVGMNILTLLSTSLFPSLFCCNFLKKNWFVIREMAQTVQKKQKRRQSAIEAQDSTPPAPKRVKVSQTQTARKSTGGREPAQKRRRAGGGGGGDDGDDGDGDDDNDPRAGPSRQRMSYHYFSSTCSNLSPVDQQRPFIDACV